MADGFIPSCYHLDFDVVFSEQSVLIVFPLPVFAVLQSPDD